MKIRLAFVAVALAALAAPAIAQQGTPPTPEQQAARFDAADKNHDGKLSKEEFTAMLPDQMKANADAIFARRDADKDGFISKAEFTAPMQRPAQ